MFDPTQLTLEAPSFLIVVGAGALAGTLAVLLSRRGLLLPVVVAELLLGVLLGPQVLGWAQVTPFIGFFSSLGLGMLFFFAGYEIDLRRISSRPLALAAVAWLISLALAYSVGGLLAWAGVVVSLLYTGSALATTSIGTLIPILRDSGELKTPFGNYLLAAGAVGEFGPILLLTVILSMNSALHKALILVAFIVVAVGVAVITVRASQRTLPLLAGTLESSSQLAVRWVVLLVFALALLAAALGLDLLLGGFAAGLITREVLRDKEVDVFDSKLTAVAFGFFIPFFFVVSGMGLAVNAILDGWLGVAKVFIFLALFLLVRGLPALLLYRRELNGLDRGALALFSSTQLPLVLAITVVAVDAGQMHQDTAAALVAAGVLSTLIYPIAGLRLRRRSGPTEAAPASR
jgi:Kef-type K+ transport system membrane component KefB